MSARLDCTPGIVMGDTVVVVQLPDGTWRATQEIGSIFGSEVEGQCSGAGATREEALAALRKDIANCHEALWA